MSTAINEVTLRPTLYKTIAVTPLTPHVGAEIGEIDLTREVNATQIAEIRAALLEHGVVFFREQPIDVGTLKRFGQRFGELHIHSSRKGLDEHPEVRPIHADATSKHVAGEEWHTDLSCDAIPPMGSILHIHTLPPLGGDTIWASMYAAYEALSDRMKTYLEGLTATHDGRIAFGRFDPNGKYPVNVHRVIVRHPETKRPVLYVNRGFTSHINELPASEGADLLQVLYKHLEKPDFQVRFRWRKDSIAFWDNRCTQHLAIWDYYPQVRSGFRVQIKGANPPFA
jgi:taurine dioxygenase